MRATSSMAKRPSRLKVKEQRSTARAASPRRDAAGSPSWEEFERPRIPSTRPNDRQHRQRHEEHGDRYDDDGLRAHLPAAVRARFGERVALGAVAAKRLRAIVSFGGGRKDVRADR